MQLLNLDEIAPIQRTVMIKGIQYEIHNSCLGDVLKDIQEGKDKQPTNNEEAFALLKQRAQASLPTCPEEVINSLTIKQCTALLKFINAEDEELIDGEKKDHQAS